jgi:hypothetical protein
MRMHHANRQHTDITVIPSGSGINGYKTAADPSATQLVVGTETDSNPTNTDAPDFDPGFVSRILTRLGPCPVLTTLLVSLGAVSS